MMTPTGILVAFILVAVGLIAMLALRPAITAGRGGKILAFVSLFILPSTAFIMGTAEHVERSKKTQFCLSCHVMADYGRSLHVDDEEFVAASHFQNNRVPREEACYACHTGYTMYGDISAKIRGLRHVYVQYLGQIPETIELYDSYDNRECLHCHLGARSFEEETAHRRAEGGLTAMKENRLSCLDAGCHDVVHDTEALDQMDFWESEVR